jgi:hypothetical protein
VQHDLQFFFQNGEHDKNPQLPEMQKGETVAPDVRICRPDGENN